MGKGNLPAPREQRAALSAWLQKFAGYSPASVLSPELTQTVVAQGSTKVENPTTAISSGTRTPCWQQRASTLCAVPSSILLFAA